jgi:haloacetate dehalogenase
LIQAEPIPETLIGANPEFWLNQHMSRYAGTKLFNPACWQEYIAALSNPECLHAMCEDYRAAASIDLEHDRQDRLLEKKLSMPVRVLWGEHGLIERCFKPIEDWQLVAEQVSGRALACGHYLPEENPQELIQEIRAYMCS